MALIICPECGNPVSNQADNCVHCGFPIKAALAPPKKAPVWKGTVDTFLIVFAIIMMVIGCLGGFITLFDSFTLGAIEIASTLLFGFLLIALAQILDLLSRIDYYLQEKRND